LEEATESEKVELGGDEVRRFGVLQLLSPAPTPSPLEASPIPVGPCLEVGRGTEDTLENGGATLRLADRLISSRHFSVTRVEGAYALEDHNSTNGTTVDGRVVGGRTRLHDGALVLVGHHGFVFRLATSAELRALEEDRQQPFGRVPTASPALALLLGRLRRLARSPAEILLCGETGVGKEVHANLIHEASGRRGPFVPIDCAAIPAELLESELYGYERGAHSTAHKPKKGLIEQAQGGTLFLDEIGEMPPTLQTKLLRFLQSREFVPLGGTTPRRVDVRVVAATNRAVGGPNDTALRSDILARLGADAVVLPPLRARLEDLPRLVRLFLGADRKPLSQAAFKSLCLHGWPRNVRELGKVIESALVLSQGSPWIELAHLPEAFASRLAVRPRRGRPGTGPKPARDELEALLRSHEGNVARVSASLSRHTASVWRWLKEYGLDPERYRRGSSTGA
jgi:transcriptional regulator with PAS, ATPase and Fis domain